MHREYQPSLMAEGHTHAHDHAHDHPHDPAAERRMLAIVTAIVGILLGLDLILAVIAPEWRRPYGVSLALLAAIIGGGRIIFLALEALLQGRVGADIALAIACIAAALAGEFFVAAEVVFIALVGECLEAFTFGRAERAIRKLLEFRPTTACVVRDGVEQTVPTESLQVGDVIVVRPGERVAVDGVVLAGRSAVDQSVLTGEGMPVDKDVGDAVYQGTFNQFGRLDVRAEKVGNRTTFGQVLKLLAESQSRRSGPERAADRYARLFLPAVLTISLLVFVGTNVLTLWGWLRTGSLPARLDVMPTLAVLVVACPCGLILATPAAVLAATTRLARRGVLVKGGAALERLAQADAWAFDKTGTLTEGRPELAEIVPLGTVEESELLGLAASAEHGSEHPLARLLVESATRRCLDIASAGDFQAQPGAGVVARVRGAEVVVGNRRLLLARGIVVSPEAETALELLDQAGQTPLLIACDGQLLGVFGARDRVRREAHDIIHDLKHLNLKDLTVLTGDRTAAAKVVGKKVHIKQVEAELTPADKAEWVQRRQREGRVVAMVGDGINDAPALATADVGIALGGVGSDLAAEAGSIVLMGEPLAPLPELVVMARRTMRVIRQNILIFAFGLNGIAVLLAGLRVLGPVAAAILHQIGSLLVLLNAIRLLGFEGWAERPPIRWFRLGLETCRRCRPSIWPSWLWAQRRPIAALLIVAAVVAELGTAVVMVGPEQQGIAQRFGRWTGTIRQPGLHLVWPYPLGRVTLIETDRVRVARVGLEGTEGESLVVAWGTKHAPGVSERALFFTGDENLVELAGTVEYRIRPSDLPALVFAARTEDIEIGAAVVSEAVFREVIGRRALEDILVARRREIEEELMSAVGPRLNAAGLPLDVLRVRIVDAHPPRDVVPAFRDVAASVADAERARIDAESDAARSKLAAQSEAQAVRDSAQARALALSKAAQGRRQAFVAHSSAHASEPMLTEFRLLADTWAAALADRSKVLIDPASTGRRHLWLADPDRWPGLGPALPQPADLMPQVPQD